MYMFYGYVLFYCISIIWRIYCVVHSVNVYISIVLNGNHHGKYYPLSWYQSLFPKISPCLSNLSAMTPWTLYETYEWLSPLTFSFFSTLPWPISNPPLYEITNICSSLPLILDLEHRNYDGWWELFFNLIVLVMKWPTTLMFTNKQDQ